MEHAAWKKNRQALHELVIVCKHGKGRSCKLLARAAAMRPRAAPALFMYRIQSVPSVRKNWVNRSV